MTSRTCHWRNFCNIGC